MPRSKVKITVLKRVDPSVIFDGDVPNVPGTDRKFEICTAFEDGQEFVVEMEGNKPEGFCVWAWNDLFKDLSVLHFRARRGEAPPTTQHSQAPRQSPAHTNINGDALLDALGDNAETLE